MSTVYPLGSITQQFRFILVNTNVVFIIKELRKEK